MAKPQTVPTIRRQAITYKSTEQQASIASLSEKFHFHYCSVRDCRLIYSDACRDIRTNRLCHEHRGTRRPVWLVARDPQECCIGNCSMVGEAKEIVRYQLGGPGPWFQCSTCYRAHGWPCN